MKKIHLIIPVLIVSIMFLGCLGGNKKAEEVLTTTQPETTTESTGSIEVIDKDPVENTQLSEVEWDLNLPIPQDSMEFTFSSGAGGWGTVMTLKDDGSFTGEYHDSEMGDMSEEYPNGTVYVCNFSGKFENIKKVNEYTYKMTLSYIDSEETYGEEWIEDGTRYIGSNPYGLESGKDFYFYLPETPVHELSEGFMTWSPNYYSSYTLDYYGIWNVENDYGFFG